MATTCNLQLSLSKLLRGLYQKVGALSWKVSSTTFMFWQSCNINMLCTVVCQTKMENNYQKTDNIA